MGFFTRTTTEAAEPTATEVELAATLSELELVKESMADVELALEDRGWLALSMTAAQEFTREGKRRAAALTRILVTQNPLMKRGVGVRAAYVWGGGVEVQAKSAGDEAGQDVNAVIQAFLDANEASFSGSQAREEDERQLGTDGDIFRAHFTSPLTGRVKIRSFDPNEIQEIICNPQDRDEPWFYVRQYVDQVIDMDSYGAMVMRQETKRAYYPALAFRPLTRPRTINGDPVHWDAPVLHIAVNRLAGWMFGVGDAYPAIFWARAYKEFLEDWARLTKSLSRFAWRMESDSKTKATRAAAAARASLEAGGPAGGAVAAAGTHLEAISKSGATIDAESGRPLAGMVAAAFGIPVTMLLSDPGQTGARAVAETLDEPMRLEIEMRRSLHKSADRQTYDYVIDMAVKAPQGPLTGTVSRDEYDREIVTLTGDVDRTVEISFPSLEKTDIGVLVKAIVDADGTDKVPPVTVMRLLLLALGVDDVDQVIEDNTDEDGNWIDPALSAGQAAVDRFNRGEPTGLSSRDNPAPPAAE